MVTSVNNSKAPNIFAAPTAPQETSLESTDSFTDQLSTALAAPAAKSAEAPVRPSQDSGARQVSASGGDVPSAPPAPPKVAALQNGTASGEPLDDAARAKLIQSEIDAYWAEQPAAVQQLRNIPDFAARMSMAEQLASQGYSIDKGIMVWGYDPMKTMVARQIYGYSWVPSLNQPMSSPPPGMEMSGQTAYDAAHPAAGSIKVSTKFADGLGITDPFALYQQS